MKYDVQHNNRNKMNDEINHPTLTQFLL